jgi:ribosomal protein S24E
MRLFGVSEIFKDKKSINQKEAIEKMKEGDRTYAILEEKFIAGEEITVEEYRDAEKALQIACEVIEKQWQEQINIFADKITEMAGAPSELIGMMTNKFTHHATTVMTSICYKKALLKLIRKKYKIERTIDLDSEDLKDTEDKKNKEKGE